MNHADMRILLREAFRQIFGREASICEAQCLQAIAALESAYGTGWKPPGDDSNNYGAIQAGSAWHEETFQYTDTRPNTDGTSTPYITKFRKYPTPIAGALDLVKVVYQNQRRDTKVLPFASKGDTLGFSRGLYETVYYQGSGATPDERITRHHAAVERSIRAQADALHESLPADLASKPRIRPTIKLGASGLDVEAMQTALNKTGAALKVDGGFGPKTAAALAEFQRAHGLDADGVCGPATWVKLEAA